MSETLRPLLPVSSLFDAGYLEHNEVLPLDNEKGRLQVAVSRSPAPEVLDDLQLTYGLPIEQITVSRDELVEGIRWSFAQAESVVELIREWDSGAGSGEDIVNGVIDARDLANQPPVIRFVNLLIRDAHEARASDIHLESTDKGMRVRFRVDGVLADAPSPPPALQAAVVSRVKLLADLDIAERRHPQDGRIRLRLEERELDLRVATVPTLHGESVVLRLLDRGGRPVALDELGLTASSFDTFRQLALKPHGLLLATGPTGSGKTTTLYAAMGLRPASAEKIITVEDPIEYHLRDVTQVPVHGKAGVTFATALRSILRQDPDVLMIGEMRDPETAAIGIQAAMTGHLVFSTVHTNDAVSALARLVDLGVEPYMVAAALEGVLAQRLVRRTCSECRERYKPDPQSISLLARRPAIQVTLEHGRGCAACRNTGYKGRTGLFELLVMTDELKNAFSERASLVHMRELARSQGMLTLHDDGWAKVQAGLTTVEEVLRVTQG